MNILGRAVLAGLSCGVMCWWFQHHEAMIAQIGGPMFFVVSVAMILWTIAAVFFSEDVIP